MLQKYNIKIKIYFIIELLINYKKKLLVKNQDQSKPNKVYKIFHK